MTTIATSNASTAPVARPSRWDTVSYDSPARKPTSTEPPTQPSTPATFHGRNFRYGIPALPASRGIRVRTNATHRPTKTPRPPNRASIASARAQRSAPTRVPHPLARNRGPCRRPARKARLSPTNAAEIINTIAGANSSVPAYARKPTRSRVASLGTSRPKIRAVSPATTTMAAR
jgi:hypothetical protein